MEKRQRVEIKERDEWSGVAEFLGNIIAKYVDVVDLDALYLFHHSSFSTSFTIISLAESLSTKNAFRFVLITFSRTLVALS